MCGLIEPSSMLAAGKGLPELIQPAGVLPSNSRTQPSCFSRGISWLSAAPAGCDRHRISSDDRDRIREDVGRMGVFPPVAGLKYRVDGDDVGEVRPPPSNPRQLSSTVVRRNAVG